MFADYVVVKKDMMIIIEYISVLTCVMLNMHWNNDIEEKILERKKN